MDEQCKEITLAEKGCQQQKCAFFALCEPDYGIAIAKV
jgi:hypothetical protein